MSLKPPTEGTPSTATFESRVRSVESNSALKANLPVSLVDLGADATGVVAADSFFTTAIATGRPIDLGGPGNVFKITSGITLASGSKILGKGATIDFSSAASTFTAMSAAGTAGSDANLAGNAAEGDAVLNASSTGFTDAGFAKVSSTAVSGTTSIPKGEIVRILLASAMTTYERLADSYATADTAKITPLNMVNGVHVEGVRFLGPTANTQTITGLSIATARNVTVRDCVFERCHYTGLLLQDAIAVSVSGCHFQDITKAGFAYGIQVANACQDVTITGCTGKRMRHLVTHTGATGVAGMPRRTLTEGCIITEAMDAGFDCHPGAEDVSFVGCTTVGGDQAGGAQQDGIIHQGSGGAITGCTVRNVAGMGIYLQPLSAKAGQFAVSGNKVYKAGDRGIYFPTSASAAVPTAVAITGNVVDTTAGQGGIEINALAAAAANVTITGNSVRGTSGHAILLSTVNGCVCSSNAVENPTAAKVGIYLRGVTDGACSGNVVRMGSATSTVGIRVDTDANALACSDVAVTGNRVTGAATGVSFGATTTNSSLTGNLLRGNTTVAGLSTGAGNRAEGNVPGVVATVASAATVTLPASEGSIYKISGTTTIDTITATNMGGRRITLITTSTAGLSDGVGNIKLSAAFTGTADDAISLVCDGTSWFQTAPSSVN